MKYTFSREIFTPEGVETFTAVECASFDEAQKFVTKGIYERKLELEAKYGPAPTNRPLQGLVPGAAQICTQTSPQPPRSSTSGATAGGDNKPHAPGGATSGHV